MPHDLAIQPALPVSPSPAEPRPVPAAHDPVATDAGSGQPYANPSLRLDPSLGLVVIEFHNDTGAIASSIPSQRQIQAYRMHQQDLPGQPREAVHDPPVAAVPAPAATPAKT